MMGFGMKVQPQIIVHLLVILNIFNPQNCMLLLNQSEMSMNCRYHAIVF